MKTMKLFAMLSVFALNACAEWRSQKNTKCDVSDYRLIAGIRADESALDVPNSKIDSLLHRANIEFFYGDHASRLTQLYCLKRDSEKVRVLLGHLPDSERRAVFLMDSEAIEKSPPIYKP